TRSDPRAGFYAFVSRSQFPQGDRRGDGDERVQSQEGERVLEPPHTQRVRTPAYPVRVESRLESRCDPTVLEEDTDLPILRRRAERPLHARDEARAAVHDHALVVQPLDRTAWLEQPRLHREVLFL